MSIEVSKFSEAEIFFGDVLYCCNSLHSASFNFLWQFLLILQHHKWGMFGTIFTKLWTWWEYKLPAGTLTSITFNRAALCIAKPESITLPQQKGAFHTMSGQRSWWQWFQTFLINGCCRMSKNCHKELKLAQCGHKQHCNISSKIFWPCCICLPL